MQDTGVNLKELFSGYDGNRKQAMNDLSPDPFNRLDVQSDDALRALIARAEGILKARDLERKKRALTDIRRIAKEHGLDVAVKEPGRKRDRARKKPA